MVGAARIELAARRLKVAPGTISAGFYALPTSGCQVDLAASANVARSPHVRSFHICC
jgi:hypothetical protein